MPCSTYEKTAVQLSVYALMRKETSLHHFIKINPLKTENSNDSLNRFFFWIPIMFPEKIEHNLKKSQRFILKTKPYDKILYSKHFSMESN